MFYWFLFGTKRVRVVLSRLYYNSSKEYRTNIKTFIERKKQIQIKAFPYIAMIGLMGVLITMSIAAHEGGKLSHPELYQTPPAGAEEGSEDSNESEEH